jgi:hypothetical protein
MRLLDDGELLEWQRASLQAHVSEIWARYGVSLEWRDRLPEDHGWDDRLLLVRVSDATIARQSGRTAPAGTLGAVVFVPDHGLFRETIFVSPGAVKRLLARAAQLPDRALLERLLGRVLARVIAHEVGHILLDMPGHAAEGLMKASFDADDLLAPTLDHLQVSSEHLAALTRTMAADDPGTMP